MKTLAVFAALGFPLVGLNLAVADAAGLDAAVEIAKQVPALLVLTWMVSKFLVFLGQRDVVFASHIDQVMAGYRASNDRSTDAIRENTRATLQLVSALSQPSTTVGVTQVTSGGEA